MTAKERILFLFETNRGVYLSGERIADELGISRAAVWKAVKKLKEEGYSIHAIPNRGYCLSSETDILSSQGIQKYLKEEAQRLEIHVSPVVDSTNSMVWKKADEGAQDGYVLAANEQITGRGRTGRYFFSPKGTGVYLSILLRPQGYGANQALQITTLAAVAVCEAIEEVSGKHPGIKWVNDIFLDGRKICGILTEASFGMESGLLDYAVLGVGINVYRPEMGFPEELRNTAGFLFEKSKKDLKNRLAASFLHHFMTAYAGNDKTEYIRKYREYSFLVEKEIDVLQGNEKRRAFVRDIDEECRLVVEYGDGRVEALSYGEVSIVNQ